MVIVLTYLVSLCDHVVSVVVRLQGTFCTRNFVQTTTR
jgi:hypothetical protein